MTRTPYSAFFAPPSPRLESPPLDSSARPRTSRPFYLRRPALYPLLLSLALLAASFLYLSSTSSSSSLVHFLESVSPLDAHPYPDNTTLWPDLTTGQRSGRELKRLSRDVLRSQGARARLQENLREDRGFVISMLGAGWNNQVIQIINLIHLSFLSSRTPILPPFRPRVPETPFASLAVSDIFSLHGLSASLQDVPFVELHELKHSTGVPDRLTRVVYDGAEPQVAPEGGRMLERGDVLVEEKPEREEMGCWSMGESRGEVAGKSGIDIMEVDTIWTPLPRTMYAWEDDPGRPSFQHVAYLFQHTDGVPPESQAIIDAHSLPQPSLSPDTHVQCVDSTFGFSDDYRHYDVGNEYRAGLGAWGRVGRFLRFREEIVEVSRGVVREVLGLKAGEEVPPYIGVHIRRDDFSAFLELSPRQYAYAVDEVLRSLRDNLGLHVGHVLVTTDETDPLWLKQLDDYGWRYVNHTQLGTHERYGEWGPVILDAVILAGAKGFVGVDQSTMSILAYRRVIDWNSGVARLVWLGMHVPDHWHWDWQMS